MKITKDGSSRLSKGIVVNDKVRFYVGKTDRWGFAISYSSYERSFSVEVLHWYAGVEVYYKVS